MKGERDMKSKDTPAVAPEKPCELALWIADGWPIRALEVQYVQTGVDSATTVVVITPDEGKARRVNWDKISDLVEVKVDYNSVLRLRWHENEKVKKWREFEAENDQDLRELARLKTKLGLE